MSTQQKIILAVSAVCLALLGIFLINKENTQEPSIMIAWEAFPKSIDPRFASDANSQYLENLVHCSLVGFNPEGAVENQLAESLLWSSSTELKVNLRNNFKFSDGTSVKATDVKATYDFFISPDVKDVSPRKGAFAGVSKITVTGEHALSFELKEPDASFVSNLVIGIIPEKLALGPAFQNHLELPGCGAFQIAELDTTHIKLTRNPHSPHFVQNALPVLFKLVQDETTRFAKLQKGELDIVQGTIGRDKVKKIQEGDPKLTVVRKPGINTSYLGFNMKDPLTANPAVRKAISLAVNRDDIIQHVLLGYATKAKTLLLPTDNFLNPDLKEISFDLEAAKKILDEAGLKDPDGDGPAPRFKLTYKTTTDTTRTVIAKAIANDLAKIGIAVDVISLEWGKFKEDVEKGNVQLWSLTWVGFKDADIYRFAFATESMPPNGGNRGYYSNAALDLVLKDAKKEIDVNKRKNLYIQAQKIIDLDLPYVFLWHEDNFAVLNKDIQNYELYGDGRLQALIKTTKLEAK